MLSTPKDARLSFANGCCLAFIWDSRKRINSETLLLFRLKRSLVLNDLRLIDVQLDTPHPFFVIRELNPRNGTSIIPPKVDPFWLDSDQPLICGSCHYIRILNAHISIFCVQYIGIDSDPVLEHTQCSDGDDDSIPGLYSRYNYSETKFIVNDDTLSVNEFQSDFTVIIKDLTGNQCRFNFSPFMSVNLVKGHYHRLHGLGVARQRLIFNGKVMSDEDTLHSYGIWDHHSFGSTLTWGDQNEENKTTRKRSLSTSSSTTDPRTIFPRSSINYSFRCSLNNFPSQYYFSPLAHISHIIYCLYRAYIYTYIFIYIYLNFHIPFKLISRFCLFCNKSTLHANISQTEECWDMI